MNFINKYMLCTAALLMCSFLGAETQAACDLPPPAPAENIISCWAPALDAEVPRTCCVVHHNKTGVPCTELWCHTPDQCSWELLVRPQCGWRKP